jgi:Ca2+-binding EF-hand superfamily protein
MAKAEAEQTLIAEKVKLRMSLKEIKTLINDVEKDGKVDTDELLKKVGRGPKREVMNKAFTQRKIVRKQFDNYDKDQKGYITKDEFQKVLENKISSKITQGEVDKMMEDTDRDGDGEIDFEEFLKAFSYMQAKL